MASKAVSPGRRSFRRGSRESVRDRAVVIRGYDFGEADRIIVLLTRNHGVVRAVAKGVRRSNSRFGSRLQKFVDVDVALYLGRGLATITEADVVKLYGHMTDDYDRYTAACAVLETAESLSFDADPALYELTTTALERIHSGDPTLELDAFLLHAMSYAGWAPSLVDCAQCAKPGPHRAFHPPSGGAVCEDCRPPKCSQPPAGAMRLLWLLAHNRFPEAYAAGGEFGARAHSLIRAYLQFHVERAIGSMKFLET